VSSSSVTLPYRSSPTGLLGNERVPRATQTSVGKIGRYSQSADFVSTLSSPSIGWTSPSQPPQTSSTRNPCREMQIAIYYLGRAVSRPPQRPRRRPRSTQPGGRDRRRGSAAAPSLHPVAVPGVDDHRHCRGCAVTSPADTGAPEPSRRRSRVVWLVLALVVTVGGLQMYRSNRSQSAMEATAGRSMSLCGQQRPSDVDPGSVFRASNSSAAIVVEASRKAGVDPAPWDTLPGDHLVIRCTYQRSEALDPDPTTTSLCPDGTVEATTVPQLVDYLMDFNGRVTPNMVTGGGRCQGRP